MKFVYGKGYGNVCAFGGRPLSTVRHVMFYQFWPPLLVTLCHRSRNPPKVRHTSRTPRFLVVQKRHKAPVQISLSIVRGGFVRGFCLERFVRGGFCPFPLLSEYMSYNRKLKNFKVWRHMLLILPSVTNYHTFSNPLPLERDVLYGRPLVFFVCVCVRQREREKERQTDR